MNGDPLVSVVIFRICHPAVNFLFNAVQEAHFFKRQRLNRAQSKYVRHIKRGRPAIRSHIQRILRQRLQHRAGIRAWPWQGSRWYRQSISKMYSSPENSTRFVELFCVTLVCSA